MRTFAKISHLTEGDSYPFPIRLWRIGDAGWVAPDGEHDNSLQRTLRGRFPDVPIIVGTLANGSAVWYLLDKRPG